MNGLLVFITLLVVGFIIYLQYELRLVYSDIQWYRETNKDLHRELTEPEPLSAQWVVSYPIKNPVEEEMREVKADIAQLEKVIKELEQTQKHDNA